MIRVLGRVGVDLETMFKTKKRRRDKTGFEKENSLPILKIFRWLKV